MKSKRLFIVIAVFLIAIIGVSAAAGMPVRAAGTEDSVGADAVAAVTEGTVESDAVAAVTEAAVEPDAGTENVLGLRAGAAKAERADGRIYTDSELCSMAKYFYMRTSESGVYPAIVEIEQQDGNRLISLWEKKPGPDQDSFPRYDARYSVDVYGKGVYVSKGEEIDLAVYSKVYTSDELCRLAQNYYYKMNDFYPPNADAKDNGDGTFTICLYELICDEEGTPHTSTCGWYTVDVCGMGTDDLTGARVDINP